MESGRGNPPPALDVAVISPPHTHTRSTVAAYSFRYISNRIRPVLHAQSYP